jgi:hypothetical protein
MGSYIALISFMKTMDKGIMLARSELYDLVRTEPMTALAKFGVRLIDYGSYLIMKLTN